MIKKWPWSCQRKRDSSPYKDIDQPLTNKGTLTLYLEPHIDNVQRYWTPSNRRRRQKGIIDNLHDSFIHKYKQCISKPGIDNKIINVT